MKTSWFNTPQLLLFCLASWGLLACDEAGAPSMEDSPSADSLAADAANDASGGSAGGTGGQEAPAGAEADPITGPIEGQATTYHVGPGREYEDPNEVPWGALQAGDVVNIWAREEPYRYKFGLRGRGTAELPIVINGVTDVTGRRPRFDFAQAVTAQGTNAGGANRVFGTTPEYGESLGGVVVIRGPEDSYDYAPGHIHLRNLELYGASSENSYTTLDGQELPFLDGSAGVYLHVAEDVTLENLVIHGNGNGVFTMAKDGIFSQACKRITVRNCRIYENGKVGSYREHNLYIQSHLPLIEGNYFGQVRPGSEGASYKSRSSGEVFRYNHVVASARAVDWVYSEEQQIDGIAKQAEYGTDYAYGNVIVSDASLPAAFATSPIHYGGDNLGEQEPENAVLAPEEPYRGHLYFWNNTVVFRMNQQQAYYANVFDLSLVGTRVDAWNNVFAVETTGDAATEVTWLQYAGELRLLGDNLAHGITTNAAYNAEPAMVSVLAAGGLTDSAPKFTNPQEQDFTPLPGSPAIDSATESPPDVPQEIGERFPVLMQPGLATNGARLRPLLGSGLDLGALEQLP